MAVSTSSSPVLPAFLLSLLLFTPVYRHATCSQENEEIPKIGIVGAGLGGTAAAYYLREVFGDKVEVDIFEAERVGGRLAVVNIDGQEYEAGGAVIHPKNTYMVNLAKQLGLERIDDDGENILGFYNNEERLYFQTSPWKAVTIAKMLWRYGWDLKRIQDFVTEILTSFNRIYSYQDQGMAFTTVEDLLRAMSEQFVNYTRYTARDVFRDAGFSDAFINELVMGGLRTNYGQTPSVHAFVAAVSMAGVEPGLWSVKGGNQQVAEKLLKASGAHLVKGVVTHVFQARSEGGSVSYEVQYEKSDAGKSAEDKTGSREYDILFIATPLDPGAKVKIQFEDFAGKVHFPDIPYHSLEAMFLQGRPNASFFGVDKASDVPSEIFSTHPGVFFNSVGKQRAVNGKKHLQGKKDDVDDYAVWKVFLNAVPTETQVSQLFDSRRDLRMIAWRAYPSYSPGMELPSFVLRERLYYLNAIEAAASAMEMAVIGARNAALLAHHQWHSHFDKIDELVSPSEKEADPSVAGSSAGDHDARKSDEL